MDIDQAQEIGHLTHQQLFDISNSDVKIKENVSDIKQKWGYSSMSNYSGLNEECGVFGIWNHPEAAQLTYMGLHSLQQEVKKVQVL